MITKENFVCDRTCGECCKYMPVKVVKRDIAAIKKEGYDERDFLDYDYHIKNHVLKMNGDGCVFLGKKDGKYYCKIYPNRPKVCRKYPFVDKDEIESCKPDVLKSRFKTS